MKKWIFILITIAFYPVLTEGQSRIQQAINEFVSNESLKGSAISISVINLSNGKKLGTYQEDTRLTPASIQKLITTAAALDILGPDFQFSTQLGYTGFIDSTGVLKGDLIILGRGDPSLGSTEIESVLPFDELLNQWSTAVKDLGVKKITGKIIGDGAHFKGYNAGPGWPWEDLGNYYGTGIWGLNILDNSYEVKFQLSPDLNKSPKLKNISPEVPNLQLSNELLSGDAESGDQAYIFGAPYSYKRWISGSLPIGKKEYSIYGSIPDPPFFAAFHLDKILQAKGICSQGISTQLASGFSESQVHTFYTLKSPKLHTLVKSTNHESINLYCEAFLREIADPIKSGEKGLDRLQDWLKKKGFQEGEFILKDGSGLSPQNAFSASSMTSLLKNRMNDLRFLQSLPVGGISGTAKYVFKNSPAKGKIFLKSGSMSGVRSYAGTVPLKSGELLGFCIIANNFSCKSSVVRKAMEKLMESFIDP